MLVGNYFYTFTSYLLNFDTNDTVSFNTKKIFLNLIIFELVQRWSMIALRRRAT